MSRWAVAVRALLVAIGLALGACTEDGDAGERGAATPPVSVDNQAPVTSGGPVGAPPAPGRAVAAPATDLLATPVLVPERLRSGAFAQERQLQLPRGFAIAVVARVSGARTLAVTPGGEVLVTRPRQGEIVALRPGADGEEAAQRSLVQGLQCPYGMVIRGDALFVAQSTRIDRFPLNGDGTLGAAQPVVTGLPTSPCGPHHYRPLAIDGDGNLYTAFGSSCNVCVEQDPRRGTVWRYAPNGAGNEYARGLRNVVDLALNPETGQLWVATNERDELGDDVPAEPVGPINQGADYGWPDCFWNGSGWVADTRVPASNPSCDGLTLYNGIQAHSAPLSVEFYTRQQFPPEYAGSAFAGLHGSWNRTSGVGFKVISIPVVDGQPRAAQDFVSGWLTGPRGPNDAWGRPVDVVFDGNGAMYISDDTADVVYRVTYTGG